MKRVLIIGVTAAAILGTVWAVAWSILSSTTLKEATVLQDKAPPVWERPRTTVNEHMVAGIHFEKKKDYESALVEYQKVLAQEPENWLPYMRIAQCQFALEDYEKAHAAVNKVMELKPSSGAATLKGWIMVELGVPAEEILAHAESSQEQYPKHAELYRLASHATKDSDPVRSLAELEEFVRISYERQTMDYDNRWARLEVEATTLLDRATRVKGNEQAALLYLAHRYLELDPLDPYAAGSRNYLDRYFDAVRRTGEPDKARYEEASRLKDLLDKKYAAAELLYGEGMDSDTNVPGLDPDPGASDSGATGS